MYARTHLAPLALFEEVATLDCDLLEETTSNLTPLFKVSIHLFLQCHRSFVFAVSLILQYRGKACTGLPGRRLSLRCRMAVLRVGLQRSGGRTVVRCQLVQ